MYSECFFLFLWNNNNGGKLISPLGVKAFAVVQKPRALKCISADRNTLMCRQSDLHPEIQGQMAALHWGSAFEKPLNVGENAESKGVWMSRGWRNGIKLI